MHAHHKLLSIFLVACTATHAATVVTAKERIEGTILAQDDKTVTIKRAKGEKKIARDQIVQIFDDNGELVWVSPALKGPETTQTAEATATAEKPLTHSIIIDGIVGSSSGGFYSEEEKFVDALGIYKVYSDGSRQQAKQTMMSVGFGINYQYAGSARWATLFTYMFRSTSHSIYTGDGQKYNREELSSQTITNRHTALIGKELRFYPADGLSTIDLIGQIGYEFGNYRPLATYVDYRTKLTPVPVAYPGPTDITVQGPTARLGGGVTFRFSPTWQMRLLAFYQGTYSMASEKIWNAVDKNVFIHDFYGVFSVGYSF
ncbi:hypothetical protein [Turneriella parva]|uniref:Outer membrane protein beta-barrel domain-containing protein n=1 Tax=Turneriella parva (strain ATCC BAA-1111 / DSM 21527 / NCTC 11395 / H) TaxID=869212 RepID=I4B201_TURPD|nr:hypothetical protein [Turneriella parva]AFM11308.1 hypothetical protein Turpa_0656 [Turneriella parva DSM 21527]